MVSLNRITPNHFNDNDGGIKVMRQIGILLPVNNLKHIKLIQYRYLFSSVFEYCLVDVFDERAFSESTDRFFLCMSSLFLTVVDIGSVDGDC